MDIKQIIIFLITTIIGTLLMVKGALTFVHTENKKKQTTTLVLTSIAVAFINIVGSILVVYSKYLF